MIRPVGLKSRAARETHRSVPTGEENGVVGVPSHERPVRPSGAFKTQMSVWKEVWVTLGDWAEERARTSVTTHPNQKSVVKVMDRPPGRTNKQIICNTYKEGVDKRGRSCYTKNKFSSFSLSSLLKFLSAWASEKTTTATFWAEKRISFSFFKGQKHDESKSEKKNIPFLVLNVPVVVSSSSSLGDRRLIKHASFSLPFFFLSFFLLRWNFLHTTDSQKKGSIYTGLLLRLLLQTHSFE